MIATGSTCRRSTMALVKWVVPIMTEAIALVSVPDCLRTLLIAVVMPLVTSSVVGVFSFARTRRSSISTASVFVPPTSTPIRKLMLLKLQFVPCHPPIAHTVRHHTAHAAILLHISFVPDSQLRLARRRVGFS
jgi:hypothetical protein